MRFTQQQIDMMHIGQTLYGTDELYGLRFVRVHTEAFFKWEQRDDLGKRPLMMRGSAWLAKQDLEPKKPRKPKTADPRPITATADTPEAKGGGGHE